MATLTERRRRINEAFNLMRGRFTPLARRSIRQVSAWVKLHTYGERADYDIAKCITHIDRSLDLIQHSFDVSASLGVTNPSAQSSVYWRLFDAYEIGIIYRDVLGRLILEMLKRQKMLPVEESLIPIEDLGMHEVTVIRLKENNVFTLGELRQQTREALITQGKLSPEEVDQVELALETRKMQMPPDEPTT